MFFIAASITCVCAFPETSKDDSNIAFETFSADKSVGICDIILVTSCILSEIVCCAVAVTFVLIISLTIASIAESISNPEPSVALKISCRYC